MDLVVLYGYSPLHVSLIESIRDELKDAHIIVIGPVLFINQIKASKIATEAANIKFLVLFPSSKDVKSTSRIFNNVRNLINLRKLSPRVLVTSNEYAIPSWYLSRKKTTKEIIVIDEGNFDVIFAKENYMPRYRISLILKKIILQIKDRLTDPRISKIVTTSDIVRKKYPRKIVIPKLSKFTKEIRLPPNSVLLLTSPLSENNNSQFQFQEISIIEEFIRSNIDKTVYIRKHYRESFDKYGVFEKYEHVKILRQYSDIPIDNIKIYVDKIIGFHSTALFADNIECKTRYTLSSLVDSKHSISVLPILKDKGILAVTRDKLCL